MEVVYKNIDEQIELILAKNILIKNKERAKDILIRENYYNLIVGYKDVFLDMKQQNKEVYQEETYFEEIYAVYQFDRELRNILLNYIAIVETNLKSCIANHFSFKYGTVDYLKQENFDIPIYKEAAYQEFLKKLDSNLKRNLNHYPDLKYMQETYQTIPLWMLTTVMTFGVTSKFYNLMKIEDKKEIARYFCIRYRDIDVYLKMLNIVRNISAHGNVLFDLRMKIKYPIYGNSYEHDILGIEKVGTKYATGMNDILAVLIILKRFLEYKEYKKMVRELETAIREVQKELDPISFKSFLNKMGIPERFFTLESVSVA